MIRLPSRIQRLLDRFVCELLPALADDSDFSPAIFYGDGSPNGRVDGKKGDLYLHSDGVYLNTAGTHYGWVRLK